MASLTQLKMAGLKPFMCTIKANHATTECQNLQHSEVGHLVEDDERKLTSRTLLVTGYSQCPHPVSYTHLTLPTMAVV